MRTRSRIRAAMSRRPIVEVQELFLDGRFEEKEDGPTAGVADQVRGEAAVEGRHRSLVGEEGSQDTEAIDWGCGRTAVD